MTPEASLKIIKKALELAELLIEAKKEFKGVPPIPDYKKGSKDGLAIVTDNKGEKYKESIILPDGRNISISDIEKEVFRSNENIKLKETKLYEELSMQIKEHLRSKGIKIDKSEPFSLKMFDKADFSEPFAHPIENKEPKIDYNVMFGETSKYKPNWSWEKFLNCKHNNISCDVNAACLGIEFPAKCNDCGQNFTYNQFKKMHDKKECKHQKVTTTQYFEPISGKVIFISKVCNNCNADLLK